jgi:hypothetical protein
MRGLFVCGLRMSTGGLTFPNHFGFFAANQSNMNETAQIRTVVNQTAALSNNGFADGAGSA